MTMPSVKVSALRLLTVAIVLVLTINWVRNRERGSSENAQLNIEDDWPTTLPDEENRIRAFDGTSIVAPEGWFATIGRSSLELTAPGPSAFRSQFCVTKVDDPFKHQRPLPRTCLFQDSHACVRILHIDTHPLSPTVHEANVVVQRNGELYELSFRTYKHFTKRVPDRIWNYLETFELTDEKLTAMLN